MSTDPTDKAGDLSGIHHTEQVIYLGRRIGATGNTVVYGIRKVEVNMNTHDDGYYSKKVLVPRWAQPGAVFLIKYGSETSYFTAGKNAPEFMGMHQSKNERTGWELEDETAATAIASLNRAKKDQELLLERRLAPLRRQYKKLWMSPTGQAALLASIIREITH